MGKLILWEDLVGKADNMPYFKYKVVIFNFRRGPLFKDFYSKIPLARGCTIVSFNISTNKYNF